jgi:hypothetical protein
MLFLSYARERGALGAGPGVSMAWIVFASWGLLVGAGPRRTNKRRRRGFVRSLAGPSRKGQRGAVAELLRPGHSIGWCLGKGSGMAVAE